LGFYIFAGIGKRSASIKVVLFFTLQKTFILFMLGFVSGFVLM